MNGKAEKKVSGGKLIKVQLEAGEKIETMKITGDFFLHPEEKITKIEKKIIGMPSETSTEKIEQAIEQTLKKHKIQVLGATAKDFAGTITEAIKNAKQ